MVADTAEVRYDGDQLQVWDEAAGAYLDPAAGEVLPTWDQALDAIGPEDEPWHPWVLRIADACRWLLLLLSGDLRFTAARRTDARSWPTDTGVLSW